MGYVKGVTVVMDAFSWPNISRDNRFLCIIKYVEIITGRY